MSTNHQMNYYDYAKTLSAEGNMTALIGGGSGPEPEQHEYVDLGLSVKWATCNIGASSPEETGLYFAWGEISGYTAHYDETLGHYVPDGKNFSWGNDGYGYENDYKFGPYDENDITNYGMTRYNHNDNLSALTMTNEPPINEIDDAAVFNWGNGWRMPTKDDFDELLENTTSSWTVVNGVSGLLLTSTVEGHEEETLFFPAVGGAGSGGVYAVGEYGRYWSASLCSMEVISAYELYFGSEGCGVDGINRYYGYSVRPVYSQNL